MNQIELLNALSIQKVLPIFRGNSDEVSAALSIFKKFEFEHVELTTSISGWQNLIEKFRDDFKVGLGTVTNSNQINEAVKLGAEFLVSFV